MFKLKSAEGEQGSALPRSSPMINVWVTILRTVLTAARQHSLSDCLLEAWARTHRFVLHGGWREERVATILFALDCAKKVWMFVRPSICSPTVLKSSCNLIWRSAASKRIKAIGSSAWQSIHENQGGRGYRQMWGHWVQRLVCMRVELRPPFFLPISHTPSPHSTGRRMNKNYWSTGNEPWGF